MKAYLLVILFLLALQPAAGIALGVNKATVTYSNVLRGGYAEDFVTVSTDTPDSLTLDYNFTGDIAEWMSLVPNTEEELIFSSEEHLRLTLIVEPPEDAANGVYTGTLRLLTGEFARTGGQYGSSVRASFAVKISVEITGNEILSCTAGGFDILSTERGYPLQLHATLKNTGNVRVLPDFEIDIWDQYQTKLLYSTRVTQEDRLLPTRQESYVETFEHDLDMGQYWALIKSETCEASRLVTFNILDLGEIGDDGELIRIDNQAWADTDDIVRIVAIFKNLGSRVVDAKFKGTIVRDGKVVQVIDTDPLNVRPLQTVELETFYNVQEPGRYEIKGRVIYNNKLTYEKSSIFTARGEVGPRMTGNVVMRLLSNPYQISMILILLAIGLLMFLINKEKRKKRRY